MTTFTLTGLMLFGFTGLILFGVGVRLCVIDFMVARRARKRDRLTWAETTQRLPQLPQSLEKKGSMMRRLKKSEKRLYGLDKGIQT